jgi:hypothetical protein
MEICFGASQWIDCPVINMEFHVCEAKWHIVQDSTGVLTRAKEEIECNGDEVGNCLMIMCA